MRKAERNAVELLARMGIKEPPINVEQLAQDLGVDVSYSFYSGEVSGMLFREEDDTKIIGVNSAHATTRQRFTIAHEIGHLLLHKGRPMIVDTTVRINMRDATASMATNAEEIQANAFAAELLMPKAWVMERMRNFMEQSDEPSDEDAIRTLARECEVSEQAMQFRLMNLGIITSS